MKNKRWKSAGWLAGLMCVLCLGGCSGQSRKSGSVLDEMKISGEVKMVNGDSVWVCNLSALKDTITLPLSEFAEEMQIIKLDNRDEALVPTRNVVMTDKHILVWGKDQTPFKLFDTTGKFLCNVGSFGQGPGEYQLIYDAQIDEAGGRIYLLPWNARALLVYDMQGQALQSIPLPVLVPKGVFRVNAKEASLSVFLLPFDYLPYVAWTQNFQGDLLDSVPAGHLALKPDFSNEVSSGKNGADFDVSLSTFFEKRPDSLYHYKNGRLQPRFTLNFGGKEITIHGYTELPRYFLGDITIMKQVSDNSYTTEAPENYIFDKQTLKGAFYRVENDYWGNMPISWFQYSCRNGYFSENWEPSSLKSELEKHLASGKEISAAARERMQKLVDGIQENDNNYVVYAKLK